jgi:hypothetical protein
MGGIASRGLNRSPVVGSPVAHAMPHEGDPARQI